MANIDYSRSSVNFGTISAQVPFYYGKMVSTRITSKSQQDHKNHFSTQAGFQLLNFVKTCTSPFNHYVSPLPSSAAGAISTADAGNLFKLLLGYLNILTLHNMSIFWTDFLPLLACWWFCHPSSHKIQKNQLMLPSSHSSSEVQVIKQNTWKEGKEARKIQRG